jgi:hypothetical protein
VDVLTRVLGPLLLASCSSQALSVEYPMATVRAPSREDADFVAWVTHEHGPEIAAMLGVDCRAVEVTVLPVMYLPASMYPSGEFDRMLGGYCTDDSIVIAEGGLLNHGHVVAHELVHAYLDGVRWYENLPFALREGVAEFVGLHVTGELDARRRLLAGLEVDSPHRRGFEFVDRVGLETLIALGERGPVDEADLERLLGADGAGADPRSP